MIYIKHIKDQNMLNVLVYSYDNISEHIFIGKCSTGKLTPNWIWSVELSNSKQDHTYRDVQGLSANPNPLARFRMLL